MHCGAATPSNPQKAGDSRSWYNAWRAAGCKSLIYCFLRVPAFLHCQGPLLLPPTSPKHYPKHAYSVGSRLFLSIADDICRIWRASSYCPLTLLPNGLAPLDLSFAYARHQRRSLWPQHSQAAVQLPKEHARAPCCLFSIPVAPPVYSPASCICELLSCCRQVWEGALCHCHLYSRLVSLLQPLSSAPLTLLSFPFSWSPFKYNRRKWHLKGQLLSSVCIAIGLQSQD